MIPNISFCDSHCHHHFPPEQPQEDGREMEVPLQIYQYITGLPDTEFFSVGIHPGTRWNQTEWDQLVQLACHANCLAIGECGLDRLSAIPLPEQNEIFAKQIQLSERLQKPLILHAVRTQPECLALRSSLHAAMPWIVHGFHGNVQKAQSWLTHGCLLSFGSALLRGEDSETEALRSVPEEQLFLETDNSSDDLKQIYQTAADLRNTTLSHLKSVLFQNCQRIFFHGSDK